MERVHRRTVMVEEQQLDNDDLGPRLMESELTAAIERLKGKKAEGEDGIPAVFTKALNTGVQREFCNICNSVWIQYIPKR